MLYKKGEKKFTEPIKQGILKKITKYLLSGLVTIFLTIVGCYIYDALCPHLPLINSWMKEKNEPITDFSDEKIWQQYLGQFLTNGDNNYFSLASSNKRALLKFYKEFSEGEEVKFKFKPLSGDSANVVISVGNLYEIVIGDNDFETVSVKARSGVNGEWVSIPDKESHQLRRKIIGGVRRGSEVIVKLNTEYYHLEGNYFLDIEIKYIPKEPVNSGYQNFHSQYIFTPPFQEYASLDISIGLINPNNETDIAAEFISFKVEKNEN